MSRTVLIVEDTDFCADTLEIAFLAIPHIQVRVTGSANEALRLLRGSDNVDALITDLNLPGMSGFDLIAQVRAEPRFASLPIFVISGDSGRDTPERVRKLGATYYFPKPYSPAEVCHALEKLLPVE